MKDDNSVQNVSHKDKDANRDPITKTPGAHPVGTGAGAVAGGTAGGVIGAVGGPIGVGVGVVVGAIAGGLGGKGIAEMIDPTVEDAYWKEGYSKRPYVEKGVPYETYQPAYRTGYEGYTRYSGKAFEDVEPDLQRDYEKSRGDSTLSWDKAKSATRDAWDRLEKDYPRDRNAETR